MSQGKSKQESRVNYRALTPHTPYITSWSTEKDPPHQLIERRGIGVGYLDETLIDRDDKGVLWYRTLARPREGEPDFGRVHPLRQRRAMRRLLCQVCAGPADQSGEGVLWLLKDHRGDWPGWPENMAVTEPPVCLPCVRVASRLCPALRNGAVTIRVRRAPVSGVRGTLYRSGGGLVPVEAGEATFPYDDPGVRWVRAASLVRELHDCTIVAVEDVCRSSTGN
jgi:hypothetical protein